MGAACSSRSRRRHEHAEALYESGMVPVLSTPTNSLQRLTSTDHGALMLTDATAHEKSVFVTKVFLVLASQAVAATLVSLLIAVVAGEAWLLDRMWLVYLAALGALVLVLGPSILGSLAPQLLRDIPPSGCVLLLALAAALTGVAVGLGCAAFAQPAFVAALASAAATFAGMTAFAHYTASNFDGVFPYAFAWFSWVAEVGALLMFADESDLVPLVLGAVSALLLSTCVIRNVQLLVSSNRPVDCEFAISQYTLAALTCCYVDTSRLLHETSSPSRKMEQAVVRTL
mmetsp:Transcript_18062/g.51377  ORF Transcript_18062/g.51377 Transcript_18062/m.51377 type:complete len:286 (+) Transcript_18062:120-977(+)